MGDVIPDDDLGKALKKFRQLQADKQYESILASDEPGVTTDNYEQQVPTFVPVKQEDGSYAVEFNGKKIGMIEKR